MKVLTRNVYLSLPFTPFVVGGDVLVYCVNQNGSTTYFFSQCKNVVLAPVIETSIETNIQDSWYYIEDFVSHGQPIVSKID